ncbi:MAG: hypothetical protein BHW08_01355 [Clostridium sp. CAG:12237_41]|nr:MAG: hypothetical protein BHW08_01355 [Clostridium sp. CAG:12237_41]
MKKKAILKIPPIPTDYSERGKRYSVSAGVVDIDGSSILLLDVYPKNRKKPLRRIIVTPVDYGIYEYDTKNWSGKSIENSEIWFPQTVSTLYASRDMAYSKETYDIVAGYAKKVKTIRFIDENLFYVVRQLESAIAGEKADRAYKRRMQRLKERCSYVEPLDDEFKAYCKKKFDRLGKHIMWYKRKGRYADFKCSACGCEYRRATEYGVSYESQSENIVATPKQGIISRCEICGAMGKYQARKRKFNEQLTFYKADTYKDGLVIREVAASQVIRKDVKEAYEYTEMTRLFITKAEEHKDFCYYDGWTDKTEWYDRNSSGMYSYQSPKGFLYEPSLANIKKSAFKYCAIDRFLSKYPKSDIHGYFKAYRRYPQLEYLVKMQLWKLAEPLTANFYQTNDMDMAAARPEDMLGIQKKDIPYLIEQEGNITILNICRLQKQTGQQFEMIYCAWLYEILSVGYSSHRIYEQLLQIAEHMSIKRVINQLAKYVGYESPDDLEGDYPNRFGYHYLNERAGKYLDYLQMRIELGYDLSNNVYSKPRDLDVAHQEMVMQSDAKKIKEKSMTADEKYTQIPKLIKQLSKVYMYKDEKYQIVIPKSASDIIEEGHVLHHCVGGDNYLRAHNRQTSTILFLRHSKNPDIRFVTIEIKKDHIVQWYGAYDKKPEETEIAKWLRTYREIVNKRLSADTQKIA